MNSVFRARKVTENIAFNVLESELFPTVEKIGCHRYKPMTDQLFRKKVSDKIKSIRSHSKIKVSRHDSDICIIYTFNGWYLMRKGKIDSPLALIPNDKIKRLAIMREANKITFNKEIEFFDYPKDFSDKKPLRDTYFYKWLKMNYKIDNKGKRDLEYIVEHLETFGFNMIEQKLKSGQLSRLKLCFQFFFDYEIRPKIMTNS